MKLCRWWTHEGEVADNKKPVSSGRALNYSAVISASIRGGNCLAILALERSLNEHINSSKRFLSSGRGFLLDRMKLNGTRDTRAIMHLPR